MLVFGHINWCIVSDHAAQMLLRDLASKNKYFPVSNVLHNGAFYPGCYWDSGQQILLMSDGAVHTYEGLELGTTAYEVSTDLYRLSISHQDHGINEIIQIINIVGSAALVLDEAMSMLKIPNTLGQSECRDSRLNVQTFKARIHVPLMKMHNHRGCWYGGGDVILH